jgi:predicted amidohydrolase
MSLKVSLAQMDIQLGKPDENLAKARDMTLRAAGQGSDIIVFPELWSTGYDLENAAAYSTPTDKGIFAEMASLATEHNIHILGSCLSLLGAGQFGNTAVFFDSDGGILGEYSKIHLFRLMDEHKYLSAGDRLAIVDTSWGKSGLAICYDLRFPELFRAYALSGARVVFLPAEWPHPRLTHWQILLRARAIENQIYVIACNRVGSSKDTHFCGHSCIIDPWGETVVEAGEDEELLTAEIKIDTVDQVRARIPVFADRSPRVYEQKST